MKSYRGIAWTAIALFVFPMLWQSLHRLDHLMARHDCGSTCASAKPSDEALHFAPSGHCAACEYELVLPGQTSGSPDLAVPFTFRYIFQAEKTSRLFIPAIPGPAPRAPPVKA
ncbi:MAG: hypothetical protein IPM52_09700 [Bacteroidetes bacterium]|nr:hypothetical protein [Bacteroidota bacterium]